MMREETLSTGARGLREQGGSYSLCWCLSRWGEGPEDHPHPFFRHVTGLLPPQLQDKGLGMDSQGRCLSRWGDGPEDHLHPFFRHVTGPLPPLLQGKVLGRLLQPHCLNPLQGWGRRHH